ncbi:trimethylamine methyltransferase family protein [Desulfococcaceae bacterium HSG9]|nr:trimethylamine methyltransferase family protein [Desulfococcaceae bacterium HSG9]
MKTDYNTQQTPQFRVLADAQINKIYLAALECLQRTGVEVQNQEARELLAAAGADVDGRCVRISPRIIEDALAAIPQSFTIWGRDGEHRMEIAPGRVFFGPGPTCTFFIDPQTGERRKSRQGDPATTARVCDALDNIDYVMSLGLIDNVTPSLASVYEYAEMIANTDKPVLPWAFNLDHLKDIYQIALALTGGEKEFRRRPLFGFFSTMQPPMIHTDDDLANCLWAVEKDIPVIYIGAGEAGVSTPVTGAGLLVVWLAAALSGIAIFQLKKRGAAVCIGGVPAPMDLRSARPSYGGPEMSLYSAAFSEILRHLSVPFMGTAGSSDAKTLNLQAAIESTMQVMLSSLSRACMVHDVGFLDCADIGSLEMLIMNDEIIAMTKRVMRGIEVNDDTLMLDLINEVGPCGEFISTMETAERCRKEIWNPALLNREPWVTWKENGSLTMSDKIKQRMHEILTNHKPSNLPEEVADKIEAIIEAAEAREGVMKTGIEA